MSTIAAIATPNGVGGLAVIRISGENSIEIASRVFRTKQCEISQLAGYQACYGYIYSGDKRLDDGVLLVFKAPNSYTGEDVVEIFCHGGNLVSKEVLASCISSGAMPAGAGEFTKRAMLNGKLSLTQAEAVIDVINAESKQFLDSANAQKSGALFKRAERITEKLMGLSAQITAWVDYPDEDTPPVDMAEFLAVLSEISDDLYELLQSYETGKLIRDGIDCAIVGKPNSGKSTLMNLLSGYEKSIVTNIEGTTRDIVEEVITIDGIILKLADCAGIRETDDVVERIGVDKMKERLANSQLAIAVFDNSRKLSSEDFELIEKLKNKKSIAVINKTDLEQKIDLNMIKTGFTHVVMISAKENQNIGEFIDAIKQAVNLHKLDASSGFIANERQRACAISASERVLSAINSIQMGISVDILGVEIQSAIESLMELSGKSVSEEIINEVFERFCVGK